MNITMTCRKYDVFRTITKDEAGIGNAGQTKFSLSSCQFSEFLLQFRCNLLFLPFSSIFASIVAIPPPVPLSKDFPALTVQRDWEFENLRGSLCSHPPNHLLCDQNTMWIGPSERKQIYKRKKTLFLAQRRNSWTQQKLFIHEDRCFIFRTQQFMWRVSSKLLIRLLCPYIWDSIVCKP